jgi:hypothetical protein
VTGGAVLTTDGQHVRVGTVLYRVVKRVAGSADHVGHVDGWDLYTAYRHGHPEPVAVRAAAG